MLHRKVVDNMWIFKVFMPSKSNEKITVERQITITDSNSKNVLIDVLMATGYEVEIVEKKQ